MIKGDFINVLEKNPIIAAVRDDKWDDAISSPAKVIFYLKSNIITVKQKISEAIENNKLIFIHIDLAEGIGKDRAGIEFLAECGVSGIISTRNQLINYAKEKNLLTVQRFFVLDSKGLKNKNDITDSADFVEIMPGVVQKVIKSFTGNGIDVIAGGLIETKEEVMAALSAGATAVSTGKQSLWTM